MARTRALAEHVTRLERPAQMKRGPVLTHRPEAAPDRGAEFAVAEAERLDAVRAAEQTLAVADELARRTLERQATERALAQALDDEIIRLENEHPSADDAYRHAKKPPRALPARPAVQIEALYAEQERRRAEERDQLLREVAYLEHEHPNAAEAYRHAKEWPRALPARPANELEALYAEQNQRDRVRARAQAEEESGRQQPRVDEDPRREQALEAEPAESDVRDDLDDPEVAPGERPQVIVTHSAAEAAASLSFDGESAGLDQEVASRHAPLHEDPRREQALEAEPAESDVRDDLDDPEVAPGERPQVIVTHSAAEAAASLSFDGESAGLDQEVEQEGRPTDTHEREVEPLALEDGRGHDAEVSEVAETHTGQRTRHTPEPHGATTPADRLQQYPMSPDVVRGADRQVGGDRRAQRGPDRRPKSPPRS